MAYDETVDVPTDDIDRETAECTEPPNQCDPTQDDAKLVQQRIPGTYDPPNPAVQEAAQEYVELLTTRMKTQEAENVARTNLLAVMHDHSISECEVEGYKVTLRSENKEKIVIKKIAERETVVESE
jgi:hypothetical protein